MSNKQDTIYRFTASWCQPCKVLAKNLEAAELGADIQVIDIDVYPELAEDYGIRGVPTLVRKSDGTKLVGVKTTNEIRSWFNN